jgi:hypothetical protein
MDKIISVRHYPKVQRVVMKEFQNRTSKAGSGSYAPECNRKKVPKYDLIGFDEGVPAAS